MTLGPAEQPAAGRRICLRLAYEGTRYSGWQVQPGRPTVQGVVTEAIRLVSGESVRVQGASRTDAGVHALAQMAAFSSTSGLGAADWARAINAHLPEDVLVLAACEVDPAFEPVVAAVRKRYRYRIHDAACRPLFDRRFVWRWRGRLDEDLMRAAAPALVGEHDFTSFEATPSTRLSKVRTIHAVHVSRQSGPDDAAGAEVRIDVEGNGFLHNMVRIIAGSLVMVGAGRRPVEWLAAALAARSRPAAGPTAPPEGLLLAATRLEPNPWPESPSDSDP